jgi:hypothetical protein
VVHGGDGRAYRDDCLDLGELPLGFAEELFGFVVVGGRLAFFGNGLGVQDKVEVAEVLFALASELDGLHRRDLLVARGILSVYERVMMGEVDLAMEEIGGLGEGLGYVGKHVYHGLVDAGLVRAAVDPLSILSEHR